MTTRHFTDPDLEPTEERVLAALGRTAASWQALFDALRVEHSDLGETWSYYRDGKSWLLKVARQQKTVFWVAVEKGAFRVAFYFPERLVGALLESGLSEARKQEIRDATPHGKLRPVTVRFGPKRGVRDVMTMVELKKSLR